MYNCIQSRRRLPYAADSSRFYSVKLELLDPWILLISDCCVFFEKDSVKRHVNSTYLRFFAKISLGILRAVPVGKTYRHLRPGGIASGTGIIGQKNYVFITEPRHICYCVIVQSYHSFTKWSSLPCFLISFTTSRVLINTVAVLSQGCIPMSLFSKSLSM